jgi:hypothetical protein
MSSPPSITSPITSQSQYDPKTDPARKPKKQTDPGWKYAYWPNLANKDKIACILCGGEVSGGIKGFKQHLAGGFGDAKICPRVSTEIRREMLAYLDSNKRRRPIFLDDENGEAEVVEVAANGAPVAEAQQNESSQAAKIHPSSGTAAKQRQSSIQFKNVGNKTAQQNIKTVVEMLRKTPEEVVRDCQVLISPQLMQQQKARRRSIMWICSGLYSSMSVVYLSMQQLQDSFRLQSRPQHNLVQGTSLQHLINLGSHCLKML